MLGDCDGGQTHEAGQFPAIGGAVQELGEDVKSVPVTEGGECLGQLDHFGRVIHQSGYLLDPGNIRSPVSATPPDKQWACCKKEICSRPSFIFIYLPKTEF